MAGEYWYTDTAYRAGDYPYAYKGRHNCFRCLDEVADGEVVHRLPRADDYPEIRGVIHKRCLTPGEHEKRPKGATV